MNAPLRRRVVAWVPGVLALPVSPLVRVVAASAPAPAELPPLRAAVLHIEPFGNIDREGRQSGIFYELMAALGHECGRAVQTTVVPYPRAIAMLGAGEIDLLLAIANPSILRHADLVSEIARNEVLVLGRPGLKLERLSDLHGKTVAQIRSTDYGKDFMEDRAIRHYETTNQIQSMKMLLEQRVDAVIGTRIALFHAARELGLARNQLSASLKVLDRSIALFMHRTNGSAALAESLRKAVQTLRTHGRIDAIYEKYASGLPAS